MLFIFLYDDSIKYVYTAHLIGHWVGNCFYGFSGFREFVFPRIFVLISRVAYEIYDIWYMKQANVQHTKNVAAKL